MATVVEGTSPGNDVFDGWDPLLTELDTNYNPVPLENDSDTDGSDTEDKLPAPVLGRGIPDGKRSRSISIQSSSSSGPATPTRIKPDWFYHTRIDVVSVPFTDCRSKRDYILFPIPSFLGEDRVFDMAYKVAELVERTYFGEVNTVKRLHKFVVGQIMARLEAAKIPYSTFEEKDPKSPFFETWCEDNMGANAKSFAVVYATFFSDAKKISDENLLRKTTNDGWLSKDDTIAVLERKDKKNYVYNVLVAYGPITGRESVDDPGGFGLFRTDE